MLVSEYLNTLKAETGYVTGSMILKSSDSVGCAYKWLFRYDVAIAVGRRREVYIATSGTDENIEARTVVDSVEVQPAE